MGITKYSFSRQAVEKLYNNNHKLSELVSALRIEKSILQAKYNDLKKATDHLDLEGLNPILNPRPEGNPK